VVVAGALFLAVLLFDPERCPAKLSGAVASFAEPAMMALPLAYTLLMQILPSFSDRLDRRCQWIPDTDERVILAWPLAKLVPCSRSRWPALARAELALAPC